jgi:hypothetical protein
MNPTFLCSSKELRLGIHVDVTSVGLGDPNRDGPESGGPERGGPALGELEPRLHGSESGTYA